MSPFPSRFLHVAAARRTFGTGIDTLGHGLLRGDALADDAVRAVDGIAHTRLMGWLEAGALHPSQLSDAPEALRTFVRRCSEVPAWVDPNAASRGGELLRRAGQLAGLVLAAKCIVLGYASPGGNKPLMMSARLLEQAPQRLNETARFVRAVSAPGGALPGAPGHTLTMQVRLMHARVRTRLERSASWDANAWGTAINQHDMAATVVLFSHELVTGLQCLGLRVGEDEDRDSAHLWRYVGHVMGVDADVLPATSADAARYMQMVRATQGAPDDDARALMHALLMAAYRSPNDKVRANAAREAQLLRAAAALLLPADIARELRVDKGATPTVLPALRTVLGLAARLGVPRGRLRKLALSAGDRYWDSLSQEGLRVYGAGFALPEVLGRSRKDELS